MAGKGSKRKKEKRKKALKAKQSRGAIDSLSPPAEMRDPPDRRALEKQMVNLRRLMEKHDSENLDEANEFMEQTLASHGGRIPDQDPCTPLDEAQDIMYEAWDTSDPEGRVKLARRALRISPDCADAYVLLAEETATSLREATELYQKGVEAGERALGQEMFDEEAGHFWGMLETRPYMRAREGLALCLFLNGEHAAAVEHYRDMLRLNPGDNQGIRYQLAKSLLTLERYEELVELLEEYEDDASTEWAYTSALVGFRKAGDTSEIRDLLAEAIDANPHVPPYLLGEKRAPRVLPDYITLGHEDAAACYGAVYGNEWRKVPGALEWLRSRMGQPGILTDPEG